MAFGFSARGISSPAGTAGAAAPVSAAAGTAVPRIPDGKFVPLSVFFLQLSGEDGEGEETEDGKKKKTVTGFAKKDKNDQSKTGDDPFKNVKFVGDADHKTTATKAPRPKARKRIGEAVGGTKHFTGTASKPQRCKYCDSGATKSMIWAEGRAYIPVCDDHEEKARTQIVDKNNDAVAYVRKIDATEEGVTMSANAGAYAVPIGASRGPKMGDKDRKKWAKRLSKMMA